MSPFFGENKSAWTDMSDYVVHFSKDYKGKSAYDNMLSILYERVIKARSPFGIGRQKAPDLKSQRATCFSEVPLHLLKRLADARSVYGIVFRKDIMIAHGANPIMYAYKNHDITAAFKEIIASAQDKPEHPVWRVTPYIDAPGSYGTGKYFFEWEREWRKVGDFKFVEDEVEFLVVPEQQHEDARHFFENAKAENLGPCYTCPFIDPYWKRKKIKALLPKYVAEHQG